MVASTSPFCFRSSESSASPRFSPEPDTDDTSQSTDWTPPVKRSRLAGGQILQVHYQSHLRWVDVTFIVVSRGSKTQKHRSRCRNTKGTNLGSSKRNSSPGLFLRNLSERAPLPAFSIYTRFHVFWSRRMCSFAMDSSRMNSIKNFWNNFINCLNCSGTGKSKSRKV